jgi:serine/threonine protein kinase
VLSDNVVTHLAQVSDWPDLAGTRYAAIEELGRGGMGAVFRARDERLDREVAIKVLRAVDVPEGITERLSREARILARLEHPGIVPVHDLGVLPDGRIYYVMKLVRGQRLDAWLATNPLERERIELLKRVAETLAFAHVRGVIHRDLKPSNIMVGEFGEVLVLDWGVAKLTDGRAEGPTDRRTDGPTDGSVGVPAPTPVSPVPTAASTTAHGTVLGTAGFMAPEQARGEVGLIDQRTDVYGLGALLGAVVTPLPRRLAAIAARAMAHHPEQRYPDAGSFARELARFQDGEPVEAYRENVLERLERVTVKYRTPILLVLAYLLMRAIFLIVAGR